MTFEEWWDTTKTTATPETFVGWEHSCLQAWNKATELERIRCALICDVTPPYPFRPSLEAAHAIRAGAVLGPNVGVKAAAAGSRALNEGLGVWWQNEGNVAMDTDRELLEAAAHVAGVSGEYRTEHLCENGDWLDVKAIFLHDDMGRWNPLDDDGAAMCLAVDLDIRVTPGNKCQYVTAEWWVRPALIKLDYVRVPFDGDRVAAVRRAIVCAAAAMASAGMLNTPKAPGNLAL